MHISGKKLDEVMNGHVTARMHIRGWRAMIAMSKMLQPEGIHYIVLNDSAYIHQTCFIEQLEEVEKVLYASDSTT